VIVAVGLGLRIAHALVMAEHEAAAAVPGLDRWLTMQIAADVAAGDLGGGEFGPYESSPTYAVLLGFVRRLSGESWLVPLLLQALLGALVAPALFVAGHALWSSRAGLAAAGMAALYAPFIVHEGLTLKFALIPVTVSMQLAAAACGRSSMAAVAAAGALQAFLASLRPNSLCTLPVILGWLVWRADRPPGRVLVAFALGFLIVAIPVGGRRLLAAQAGHAASLWGIHFYVGTLPAGDGGYHVIPGIEDNVFGHVDDARMIAERELGRPLDPGEVSAYWLHAGLDAIRADPTAYLALEGRKVGRMLSAREHDEFGEDMGRYRLLSPALTAAIPGFGVVLPLAVVGLVVAGLRRSPIGWVAAVGAAYALSLLMFFVTGRYRLAMVPPLMLAGGVAVDWLTTSWPRSVAVATLIAGITLILPEVESVDVVWVAAIIIVAVLAGWLDAKRTPVQST
jgi:hypothetical protein